MPRNFQVLYGDDSQIPLARFTKGKMSAAMVVTPHTETISMPVTVSPCM